MCIIKGKTSREQSSVHGPILLPSLTEFVVLWDTVQERLRFLLVLRWRRLCWTLGNREMFEAETAGNTELDQCKFGNYFSIINNQKILVALLVLQGVSPSSESTQKFCCLFNYPLLSLLLLIPGHLPSACLLGETESARVQILLGDNPQTCPSPGCVQSREQTHWDPLRWKNVLGFFVGEEVS